MDILSHRKHVVPNLGAEGVYLASEITHVLPGKNDADEARNGPVRAVKAAIVIAAAVFTKNLRRITISPV